MESEPEGVRLRFHQLYEDLRRVAEQLMRRRSSDSLTSGDLLGEAFLRLMREEQRRNDGQRSSLGKKPDGLFKACFGAACRDVLYERWRRRTRRKEVPGSGISHLPGFPDHGLFEVLEAMQVLQQHDEQIAQIVEARLMGQMSVAECAEFFAVSPRTVNRYWAYGIAWLRSQLK